VCCSVLQCVAVCCSVLQCVAVYCSVLQCIAVCCSVLQCVAERNIECVAFSGDFGQELKGDDLCIHKPVLATLQ